ncbi:hypothetical protein F0358_10490 [Empedobacter brevis]|uniref:hypothetical protein n=1 Tax=Empedobacter brevis TaxID=247 RepID=UPI00123DD239|nr:hypothetical protein [Empedobacter brevis]QES93102.1 hypothetical protein F0358_10490 [Empedobacter brevis]
MADLHKFIENIIPITISLTVTGVISLFIGVYLEKFKNKLTYVKYKINYQPLATSNYNSSWGDIEVLFNGKSTFHLNFVTINVINDSNKDFQNLYLDLWVDENSSINGHNAYYDESRKSILLENSHYSGLVNTLEKAKLYSEKNDNSNYPQDLLDLMKYYQKNQKYFLPILNRKTSITINVLVSNNDNGLPVLNVDIKHLGLKLIEAEDEYEKQNKEGRMYVYYGLGIFVFTVITLLIAYTESYEPILILGFVGFLYIIFGVILYRFVQLVKMFFR